MRISATQRQANENRIRTAMDRLLRGEIPPGGRCDIKTLADEAGVDRTGSTATAPPRPSAPSSNTGSAPSNKPAISPTHATPRSPGSSTRPPH